MLKTENYNLNKPEVTDPLRLADFNQNSDLIDAAIKAAEQTAMAAYSADNAPWVMGSFSIAGTLWETPAVTFNFEPRAVFIFGYNSICGGAVNGGIAAVPLVKDLSSCSYLELQGNQLLLSYTSGSPQTSLWYLALK